MRYDDDMKARLSIVYDETWGDQDQVDHDDDEIDENLLVRVRMMQDMRYEDDDMKARLSIVYVETLEDQDQDDQNNIEIDGMTMVQDDQNDDENGNTDHVSS